MMRNVYYTMLDGLVRGPNDQTAKTTCTHAHVTTQVLKHLEQGKPLILNDPSAYDGKALRMFFGSEKDVKESKKAVDHLQSIVGKDTLQYDFLTKEAISGRGYDPSHISKAAVFPQNGNIPAYSDGALDDIVTRQGGTVCDHMQLKHIFVRPNFDETDDW